MANFDTFISQLDASGVHIVGRDELITSAAMSADWPAVVTEIVTKSRKSGVSFLRRAADSPSDHQIEHLLQEFPFSFNQRRMVLQNILVRP
ncbi:hypothetical protein [Noviherbaspirillum autotrophicum]|uniref:Uncharacterized protein n=1 Tax=Noviherbaspirillum autotrophicum TaxID=709839 RepID=A0A0C2BRE9_9BURK|nr:hypothetical protein [Noviherbaspirillum autotrophicum]KIF82654.1 hypothetical protein TSA66_20410 [Noviherbaspirillum autotrophicum]